MNYRHAYHAGNFADVFKHILLIFLLQKLRQKDTAFCYLDTHAGAGLYDLSADMAQRSQEAKNGILKILDETSLPSIASLYREIILATQNTNNPLLNNQILQYPGSPSIAHYFLRPQDRAILCELHKEDELLLKKHFSHHKQIAIHHQDGYQALKAFLPPKERRGLVLIDPPYEIPDETTQLMRGVSIALQRWATGIYAIWYPIKDKRAAERFCLTLAKKVDRPVLVAELTLYPSNNMILSGCGMAIINPPWQLEEELKTFLPWLWQVLSPNKQGYYSISTLHPVK